MAVGKFFIYRRASRFSAEWIVGEFVSESESIGGVATFLTGGWFYTPNSSTAIATMIEQLAPKAAEKACTA